tara:strand:- start:1677 stop:3080 length:1404 start_codon:yes stop_codon:yes gene_type:complete
MMQQQSLTPQGGVASLGNRQDMADKLANMGQFDDDQIAHVAEGEVIVPAPIMKYYPEVREQVFDVIRREGLDPQEFVVGGDLVARNPQTGMQEFGFLSKLFKKVKKVFKKLAPVILPIVLPGIGTALAGMGGVAGGIGGFIGSLGAAGTAALGSGLGGLIQGRSFKDSLKMGALSGLTVGLFKGAGNVAKGKPFMADQFGAGTTPGFQAPGSGPVTAAQSGVAATDPFVTVGKDGLINIQPVTGDVATGSRLIGDGIVGSPQTTLTYRSPGYDPTTFAKTVADKQGAFSYLKPSNIAKNLGIGGGPSTPTPINAANVAGETSFLSKVPDALVPKNPTDLVNLAGLTMVGAGLLGGGEEGGGQNLVDYEPYEPEGGVFTGLGYDPETGRFGRVQVRTPQERLQQRRMFAAAGGAISGPGTGTSDSIPAMLSDGEFVMTAKAVRGMGDGSRKKGAAEMYKMMNKLERMA